MARYIDADKIVFWIRHVSSNGLDDDVRRVAFSDEIARMPAADVVEVVRCKNCQYSKFIKSCSKYMCDKRNEGRGELKYSNDFCSDGKRKTD